MTRILIIFFLLISIYSSAQRNYDTVMTDGRGQPANVGIFEPAIYSSLTTADSLGMFVFFVGAGEATTDSTKIRLNGPMQYLSQGWNGDIIRYGKTYHLLIVTIQISSAFPQPLWITPIFNSLRARYRIKFNSTVFSGISAGGYASNEFVCYQPTGGDFSYGERVRGVVNVEGVKPDDTYGAEPAYPGKFTQYAQNGGNEIGFEQFLHDGRDINTIITTMNTARANSGVYIPTNYGGGTHGYWNYEFGGFLSTANGGDNTNQIPNKYLLGSDSLTIYQWAVGLMDTAHIFFGGAAPVAHAGGTYIYNEDPNGVNIFYPINATASTGSNLKYHWQHFTTGFYPNNSATPSTNTGIESTWDNVKQSNRDTAIVTQLWLATDSVRKYGYQLTVTDSVSHQSSIDTCYIIYRSRKDYPPQNIDGGSAFHLWGTNPTYDNAHVPSGKTHDVVFTGANDDQIHNAAGSNVGMSIFIGTGSSIVLDHTVKPTLWIAGGHYRSISLVADSIGGSGWQLSGQDTAHAFTISFYDTCVKTDFGFRLSNPRYGRLTGIYDPVNGYGRSDFPGAQNGYAYSKNKYGFQFTGNNEYIGGACASIDGVSTRWFEIDHVQVSDGHADGITIKQDQITGHSNYSWAHLPFHDNYITNIFQEGKYGGSSVNDQQHTDSSESYNNRATFCGDKGMKDVSIGKANYLHNNAVFACGLNALSPFESNVTFPRELGFFNQGNIVNKELIDALGGTDQVLNVIAQVPPNDTRVIGENKISNEVVLSGHGYTQVYVGGPFDNVSPTFTFHFDSCYFGLAGIFTGGQVYTTGQPATNTTWQSNAQPGGSSSLLDTINFTNNTYDSTKLTLFSGSAVTHLTNNTLIKAVHYPNYVNTGLVPGSMIRFYCDTIYGTYGNEFIETGTKQGQLFGFSAGDTCWYMGLTYVSRQNNNIGNMPQARTDNWWRLVTYPNGGLYPPDDIRLFTTDQYAILGIGLLDQVVPIIPPQSGIVIPLGWKIIVH